MNFDYKELEQQLERACTDIHKDFYNRYKSDQYVSAGGSKLETFINDLQKQFETTAAGFLVKYNLEKDAEAKRRVFNITKLYAKKCIEDFSKV